MLRNLENINKRIEDIRKELNMNTTDIALLKTHVALLEKGANLQLEVDQTMADSLLNDINSQIEESNLQAFKRYTLFKSMIVINATLSWGAIIYVLID